MTKEDLLALIVRKAEEHGIDHELVLAFCTVESGMNPNKNRYEPGYKWLKLPGGYALRLNISFETEVANQSMSWGMMQIMGATARADGFIGDIPELCSNPELGLEYGLRYLKSRMVLHPTDLDAAIASYNAGSATRLADGKFANQQYVDKIKRALLGKPWNMSKVENG